MCRISAWVIGVMVAIVVAGHIAMMAWMANGVITGAEEVGRVVGSPHR